MICIICANKSKFTAVASSVAGTPYLFSCDDPLSEVRVTVEVKITCNTCGHVMTGSQRQPITCSVNDVDTPYPLRMYEFVRQSYGDGWEMRVAGKRLNSEQLDNISMARGWADAQARSEVNGGRIPPKGFGHARSKEYLKSETACHHLKMLSLSELIT